MSDCDSVTWTGVLVVTDVLCVLLPRRWLRSVKVFRRVLIGNLLNRSPFLSPKSVRLFVWSIKKI